MFVCTIFYNMYIVCIRNDKTFIYIDIVVALRWRRYVILELRVSDLFYD